MKYRNHKSLWLTVCLPVSSGSLASGPSSYEVASPASQELFVFDANGTHQFTMSLVTGDYKYNFSYRLVCVGVNTWKKQKCIIIEDECNCKTLKYLTFLSFSSLDSVSLSNEEDVTAVTDSSGNTLRIRRDTNRLPVRVVAPDNQVRWAIFFCHAAELNWIEITFLCWEYLSNKPKYSLLGLQQLQLDFQSNTDNHFFKYHSYYY